MEHSSTAIDNCAASIEAVMTFNAQTHVTFFEGIFMFYRENFHDWSICIMGDNCNTNLRTAEICGRPLIGCANHKRNLEINAIISRRAQLGSNLNSVHNIVTSARKLTNSAILRNLAYLSSILNNQTRWSGSLYTLRRFLEIRDYLVDVEEDENGD